MMRTIYGIDIKDNAREFADDARELHLAVVRLAATADDIALILLSLESK